MRSVLHAGYYGEGAARREVLTDANHGHVAEMIMVGEPAPCARYRVRAQHNGRAWAWPGLRAASSRCPGWRRGLLCANWGILLDRVILPTVLFRE